MMLPKSGPDALNLMLTAIDQIKNRERYAKQQQLADALAQAELESMQLRNQQMRQDSSPLLKSVRGDQSGEWMLKEGDDGYYWVNPSTQEVKKAEGITPKKSATTNSIKPQAYTVKGKDGEPVTVFRYYNPETGTMDEVPLGPAPQIGAGKMQLPSGQTIPGNSEQPSRFGDYLSFGDKYMNQTDAANPKITAKPPETPRRLGDYLSLGEKVLQKLAPKNPSGGLTGAMPTPQSLKNNTAKTQKKDYAGIIQSANKSVAKSQKMIKLIEAMQKLSPEIQEKIKKAFALGATMDDIERMLREDGLIE